MTRILIVEDNETIRTELSVFLGRSGYEIEAPDQFDDIVALAVAPETDLLLLDINLPVFDGFFITREIRKQSQVPIIIVTSRDTDVDEIIGMNLGADDFVTKPFGAREVVARIRAVTRRCLAARPAAGGEERQRFAIGDLEVAPDELRAFRGAQTVDLSLRDVRLLRLFAANPGKVLDRTTILNHCWGVDYLPSSRTLDQHVSQLRKKVEIDPGAPRIICTVHGVGYRYDG